MMSEGRFVALYLRSIFAIVVLAEKSWTIKVLVMLVSICALLLVLLYFTG